MHVIFHLDLLLGYFEDSIIQSDILISTFVWTCLTDDALKVTGPNLNLNQNYFESILLYKYTRVQLLGLVPQQPATIQDKVKKKVVFLYK